MENGPGSSSRAAGDEPARLIHDHRVRVLNCSATGCLLETTRAVVVNTVAALQVSFGGRLFDDLVHVVRCELITDGGNIHHVAARFLSVTPPYAGSLRYVMRKETSDLAGWLNDRLEE
jgi:hypothetical protein